MKDFVKTIENCLYRDLDTFTKVLICEHMVVTCKHLKAFFSKKANVSVLARIHTIVAQQKTELLRKEITVDDSYRKTLSGAEIFTEAIKNRLKEL